MKKTLKEHRKLVVPAITLSVFSIFTILASAIGLYLSDKIYRSEIGSNILFLSNFENFSTEINDRIITDTITIEILTPSEKQTFKLNTKDIDAKIDKVKTFQKTKKSQNLANFINPQSVTPIVVYNKEKLSEYLSVIAGQLYISPVYPDISVSGNQVSVVRGTVGYKVDIDEIKSQIEDRLISDSNKSIAMTMSPVGQVLGDSDEALITENNSKLLNKTIDLIYEDYTKTIFQEELLELLTNINGSDISPFQKLVSEIAKEVERDPVNPIFKEEDGVVVEFKAAKDGIKLIDNKLKTNLDNAILELITTDIASIELDLPVDASKPSLSIEDVNSYGIKELIGTGSSAFVGSIPNRVHNVAHAAEMINGQLVAPGETFSFNETVGDISVYTGFKQSYVIQGNETVLGDGGGVCQVSTTLFRAALNAGLPISERRPHSYRVGYYEQGAPVGLDATIYSPSVDFKFTNDTDSYILIQAFVDTRKMTLEFELYGAYDGREVTLTDPIITSVSPAPEPLYVDDPSKPAGYIEQIDWAANGARVEYDYVVTRDGEELINKKFYSNYRPWQAKYIRGTGPTI